MRRPHVRITLTTTSATAAAVTTTQPTLPAYHNTTSSPPQPLGPLRPLKSPLKSPAFFHPTSSHAYNYNYPLYPNTSPCLCPPPQPQSPLAWTWRCHLCYTTYRLGITRRCLVDGHYFCSNPPPPPVSPSPLPSPNASPEEKIIPPLPLTERGAYHASDVGTGGEAEDAGQATEGKAKKAKKARRGRGKRMRAQASCTSSFDYLGWADWNAWRRESSPTPGTERPRVTMPEVVGLVGPRRAEKHQKDCFLDCDFPSECSWQRTSAYLESVMEELPVLLF